MSGSRRRLPRVLAAALVPLQLGGCGSMGCGDEVVQHEPSPYGRGTAIVFVRDCGATTDFNTQVAIVGSGDTSARDRNVIFVADLGGAPSGPGGGPRVRVRWTGADRLEVARDPRVRTFRQEEVLGDVRITYVPLP